MELWNFISLVWGYVTPILIEFLGSKVHGWGKVTLAILFALISGFIVATLENGLKIANIEEILGFAAAVFGASQIAWIATWKKILTGK